MKIYKITEASEYLGLSINTLKTLANNGKIKSFKTTGEHRRFRQEDLDAYMGVEKEKQDTVQEVEERRKLRLKMSLSNLMEFKKEDKMSNEKIGGFFIVLGLVGFIILFILDALGLGHF
jgi:excisionase family DNA binding protein